MTDSWRAACAAFLPGDPILRRLDAFGRPDDDPFGGADFGTLEAAARAGVGDTGAAIRSGLREEVDADQAAMFARRHAAVAAMLDALPDPRARVLRVGLWRRVHDVLAAAPPRALRVRAVVDFYYSQAAVVKHQQAGGPTLTERVAGLRWRAVAPGVRHARLEGPTDEGPVHVNLLEAGPGARLVARDARGTGDFAAWARAQGAVAGTSGGFFLYSEADIAPPSRRRDLVGLLVEAGRVVSPPKLRRTALVQLSDGTTAIRRLGPTDATLTIDGRTLRIDRVNAPHAGGVTAYNRAWPGPLPAGPRTTIVGDQVLPTADAIPLNGVLLVGVALRPGRVEWSLDPSIHTAIAGGPRLLAGGALDLDRADDDLAGSAPPVTFSQDETFDQNLLPRMVVGRQPSGAVVFAAIDGRNVERAPGFTLARSAHLLRLLGCTEAVNLDGGSSKRMVVDGEVVCLASTEVVAGQAGPPKVRPVHSAVLLFPAG